jgi:hypothetical protein
MKIQKSRMKFVILVTLLLTSALSGHMRACPSAGKCQDGLLRCMASAGMNIFGNPLVAAATAAWCISGYVWCIQFYEE